MMVKTSEKQTKKDAVLLMMDDAADLSTSTWRARNFKLSWDVEKKFRIPSLRCVMLKCRCRDGAMMA
jgi:hypothetical protein